MTKRRRSITMDRAIPTLHAITGQLDAEVTGLVTIAKQMLSLVNEIENHMHQARLVNLAGRVNDAGNQIWETRARINDLLTLAQAWDFIAASNGVVLPEEGEDDKPMGEVENGP